MALLKNIMFSSRTKSIALWIVIGAVLVGSTVLMAYFATRTSFQTASLVDPVASHEWYKGSANAKVTLVEYSDFQCPACAAYYPLVKQLTSEYGAQVKFVYRYFPLSRIHKNAYVATSVAEAAGAQGKFWEMHDMLFEKQTDWEKSDAAMDIFTEYAKTLSLDINKFKNDVGSQDTKDFIESNLKSAADSKVDSTPTFFLNGSKIQNPQSYEEFKKLIDQAIAQNS